MAAAVSSVEAIWKMKTAEALPRASSVRSPASTTNVLVDLYKPGVRVRPPISPDTLTGHTLRPSASVYAAVRATCASSLSVVSPKIDPLTTTPGGKPDTLVTPPGERPKSPVTVVLPVFETAVAARTAKLSASPMSTGA
jgi:hypothetical protein